MCIRDRLGCESVALGFVAGETGAWLERGLVAQGLKTDFVHLDHGMTRINVKILSLIHISRPANAGLCIIFDSRTPNL